MYTHLIQSIRTLAPFTDEEAKELTDRMEVVELNKGELLLDIGQVCQKFCFLEIGSLRHYYLDEELDEVIINLHTQHQWVLDSVSFTAQKPATGKIEAFTDCTLYSLSIHHLHHLIEQSQRYFALGKILEKGAPPSPNKSTPEQKYTDLLENQPEIIQTFPLKYIASYLGMTPETLSRVRSRIS
ncbi:MAG: cyclic nucleotide-binding domain-containing protein [Bacteroidota bacterium]